MAAGPPRVRAQVTQETTTRPLAWRLTEATEYALHTAKKARHQGWSELADQLEQLAALPAEIERLRAENAKLQSQLRYARKGPRYGS